MLSRSFASNIPYAPEFGRTPGAQISILHGRARINFTGPCSIICGMTCWMPTTGLRIRKACQRPRERQNDFGGTFAGPILKDKTFFFFSYEGLRLRLPEVALSHVPDLTARQNAIPAVQSFLNAFPLPNGTDNLATGVAQFNSSFSNKATLDAYSLRIDQHLNEKLTLFGRYNYSPSEIFTRGGAGLSLSDVTPSSITTQTGTVGATWLISPRQPMICDSTTVGQMPPAPFKWIPLAGPFR